MEGIKEQRYSNWKILPKNNSLKEYISHPRGFGVLGEEIDPLVCGYYANMGIGIKV